MFLIKSIFLVIVNKKPHFKKVPLLICQFPSPPTLNNWLFHLLNLYSFVTYLYSSSILLFFLSSHLLLPFFFFPLTRSHEVEAVTHFSLFRRKSAISAYFGGCFSWNRPYRLVSMAISTISTCFNGCFGRIDSHFRPNRPVLAQIGTNLAESARIKKKEKRKKGESCRVGRRTPRRTPVRRPWSRVSAF